MSWEEADNKVKVNSSFLKLESGEKVDLVIVGEPVAYYKKYKDQTLYTERVEGSAAKFKVNVAVKEGNAWVMKIWEGGAKVYDQLKEFRRMGGIDKVFTLYKSGKEKSTVWLLADKEPISDAVKEEVSKLKPHDLLNTEKNKEVPF